MQTAPDICFSFPAVFLNVRKYKITWCQADSLDLCHSILSLIIVMAQELCVKHSLLQRASPKRSHLALKILLLTLALVSLARKEGVGGLVWVRAVAELPMPLRRGGLV